MLTKVKFLLRAYHYDVIQSRGTHLMSLKWSKIDSN
jgi:hypothetical protein